MADDFLLNPDELVDHAESRRAQFEMPQRSYPGEVLDLPPDSMADLRRFWRTRLSRIFSFARAGLRDSGQLSLTNLQPEHFTWIQRLPHTDFRRDPGMDNYALLVYLFENEALGGTGFYRYRDEAFWRTATRRQLENPERGLELVQTRYPMFREPPRYPTDSDETVELLTLVPAKYNRMVSYSGDVPHSAYIRDPSLLTSDCRTGRLTLNSFAAVWPKR